MLYNLESLTAQEESRILQQGSKSKRQSQEKQEKLVGMAVLFPEATPGRAEVEDGVGLRSDV